MLATFLIRRTHGKLHKTKDKLNHKDIKSNNKSRQKGILCFAPVELAMDAINFNWTSEEYLAEAENLTVETAKNVIELFNAGNTIPFLARYRTNLIGGLTPEKLRNAKATYEYIEELHKKAKRLIQKISETVTPIPSDILTYIRNAKSLEDLEFLSSAFKKEGKRTYAKRARELGLEPIATQILLEGACALHLETLVNPNQAGLQDAKSVKLGIQHIIADIVSKNAEVHAQLDKIYSSDRIILQSKFCGDEKELEKSKYFQYRNFSQPVVTIKPHQTLAINRGEAAEELKVTVIIPEDLWLNLKGFCLNKWLSLRRGDSSRNNLITNSVNDAIKRLLQPLAIRRIRAKLKDQAENESINVFALNLHKLLMTPPVNGHVVMGIDPGFTHGCKVAVVSPTGAPICFDVFYLQNERQACLKLRQLISKNECEIIALGNGKGSRETESLLQRLITAGKFRPLDVTYTIINEQGVSIYSCSEEAEKEFPGVDPKSIGAISIARRLQSPLSELVKVEPKHLGVGMYQHDVKSKKLVSTLDEVVSECVSFVGVDINTASVCLLRRVAGIGESKAAEIIKYRSQNCTFKSREDLLKVKGIKDKTFLQCAGFIRVIPSTARCSKHSNCVNNFNPLDETWIHPESYENVRCVLKLFNLNLNQLGSKEFVTTVKAMMKILTVKDLAYNAGCSDLTMQFIIDALKQPRNFDLRTLSQGPIFQKNFKSLKDLQPGQILEGVVRNVVSFGAFIDLGVGQDGLIHTSKGSENLSLNDVVETEVISTNLDPPKIQLKLISVIR